MGAGSRVSTLDTSYTGVGAYYQVVAENVVGDTFDYGAGTVGFPTRTAVSPPSNVVDSTGLIFMDGFETGSTAAWTAAYP